ncbi:hypothetical protein PHET_02045 [Paragonimus heterotremus]|uniref:Kinesin motor domain-containing protein n=1 Tax=Paragonimus heterotremus TaxID=100268 RepID=A0A8J4TQT0_9TREM|nr:hypothetical protein PHET_02045 [Paragonimus heterotremus]
MVTITVNVYPDCVEPSSTVHLYHEKYFNWCIRGIQSSCNIRRAAEFDRPLSHNLCDFVCDVNVSEASTSDDCNSQILKTSIVRPSLYGDKANCVVVQRCRVPNSWDGSSKQQSRKSTIREAFPGCATSSEASVSSRKVTTALTPIIANSKAHPKLFVGITAKSTNKHIVNKSPVKPGIRRIASQKIRPTPQAASFLSNSPNLRLMQSSEPAPSLDEATIGENPSGGAKTVNDQQNTFELDKSADETSNLSVVETSTAASFFTKAGRKLATASTIKKKRKSEQLDENLTYSTASLEHHKEKYEVESQLFNTAFSLAIQHITPPLPIAITQSSRFRSVQDTSDNNSRIKVLCYLLPDNGNTVSCLTVEKHRKQISLIHPNAVTDLSTNQRRIGLGAPKLFAFDELFTENDSMTDLYGSALTNILQAVVSGSDGCLTSLRSGHSSQSVTMIGDDKTPNGLGLIPFAISWLFRLINEYKERTGARFSVRVSAVEVWGTNELLRDLLSSCSQSIDAAGASAPGVFLQEDPISGLQPENQSELRAPSAEKAAFYLDSALAARKRWEKEETLSNTSQSFTNMSHFFFTLHIYQYRVERCGAGSGVAGGRSRLRLIDLAPGRNDSDQLSPVNSDVLRPEAQSTDSAALTTSSITSVILSLMRGERHIPHQNSRLARLLREAMGSTTCHNCILLEVSPAAVHYNKNLHLLQFCNKVMRYRKRWLQSRDVTGGRGCSASILLTKIAPSPMVNTSSEDSSSCDSFGLRRANRVRVQMNLGTSVGSRTAFGRNMQLKHRVHGHHRAHSSERDYTSSSEQSCDTVIYIGSRGYREQQITTEVSRRNAQPTQVLIKSADETQSDTGENDQRRTQEDISSDTSSITTPKHVRKEDTDQTHTKEFGEHRVVHLRDGKRIMPRTNLHAWPRAAVKNAIETLSTQKEQWVDGPKSNFNAKVSPKLETMQTSMTEMQPVNKTMTDKEIQSVANLTAPLSETWTANIVTMSSMPQPDTAFTTALSTCPKVEDQEKHTGNTHDLENFSDKHACHKPDVHPTIERTEPSAEFEKFPQNHELEILQCADATLTTENQAAINVDRHSPILYEPKHLCPPECIQTENNQPTHGYSCEVSGKFESTRSRRGQSVPPSTLICKRQQMETENCAICVDQFEPPSLSVVLSSQLPISLANVTLGASADSADIIPLRRPDGASNPHLHQEQYEIDSFKKQENRPTFHAPFQSTEHYQSDKRQQRKCTNFWSHLTRTPTRNVFKSSDHELQVEQDPTAQTMSLFCAKLPTWQHETEPSQLLKSFNGRQSKSPVDSRVAAAQRLRQRSYSFCSIADGGQLTQLDQAYNGREMSESNHDHMKSTTNNEQQIVEEITSKDQREHRTKTPKGRLSFWNSPLFGKRKQLRQEKETKSFKCISGLTDNGKFKTKYSPPKINRAVLPLPVLQSLNSDFTWHTQQDQLVHHFPLTKFTVQNKAISFRESEVKSRMDTVAQETVCLRQSSPGGQNLDTKTHLMNKHWEQSDDSHNSQQYPDNTERPSGCSRNFSNPNFANVVHVNRGTTTIGLEPPSFGSVDESFHRDDLANTSLLCPSKFCQTVVLDSKSIKPSVVGHGLISTRKGGGHTSSGYESILRDSEASSHADSTSGSSFSGLGETAGPVVSGVFPEDKIHEHDSRRRSAHEHSDQHIVISNMEGKGFEQCAPVQNGNERTLQKSPIPLLDSMNADYVGTCRKFQHRTPQTDFNMDMVSVVSSKTAIDMQQSVRAEKSTVVLGNSLSASSSSSTSRRSRSAPPCSEDTSEETSSSPLSVRYVPPRDTEVPIYAQPSTVDLIESPSPCSQVVKGDDREMLCQIRYEKIYDLLAQQDALKWELLSAKEQLMVDPSTWNFDLHVAEQMDPDALGFLEALEKETEILRKRVDACKSHLMFITCFDSHPKESFEHFKHTDSREAGRNVNKKENLWDT